MENSISLKPLDNSELCNIYLRYEEENKTKKMLVKLNELRQTNPERCLIEWLGYIAFGEDIIGIPYYNSILEESVERIKLAITFWNNERKTIIDETLSQSCQMFGSYNKEVKKLLDDYDYLYTL